MSDDIEKPSATVIQLHPPKVTKASEQKWGRPVMAIGFCVVPSLLLRAQRRLNLTPTKLAILMHLADYWWSVERKPYPSKKTLGERLGLGERQIQRHIAELEEAKLVRRIERTAAHRGKLTNEYDLSGLVQRLKEIEPDFREVEENVKKNRRSVARPGIRARHGTSEKA